MAAGLSTRQPFFCELISGLAQPPRKPAPQGAGRHRTGARARRARQGGAAAAPVVPGDRRRRDQRQGVDLRDAGRDLCRRRLPRRQLQFAASNRIQRTHPRRSASTAHPCPPGQLQAQSASRHRVKPKWRPSSYPSEARARPTRWQ